uniref:ABC-type glutathione-S-conjugate transporter n=1 Tax=Tigriopus japonicus TaxID=158387 RepID=A0A0A7AS56_TIGJA|nr:ATP-binding cassette transporter sub-family C member 1 isoform X5 [Tigriopus japonicus]
MSSFEQFCGGPIWDVNATWNTNDPDFTTCFHKTALAWTPCFLLFIIVPFEVSKYVKSVNRNIPWNLYNLTKLFLTLALVVISIVELILLFVKTPNVYGVDYVTTSLFIVTYLCSLVMLLLSMHFGVHTSPAQFLFYFLSTVTGGISLRSLIKRQYEADEYGDDPGTIDRLSITFGIQYSCVILLLILNLFADAKPLVYDPDFAALTKPCPQIHASYFAKLVYSWSTPLLWKGYRNPLVPEDLWQVNPKLTSKGVVPIFDRHFKDTIKKAQAKGKKFSVYPALFYTFGPTFFWGTAIKTVNDVLAMVAPQIMSLMIAFVSSDNNTPWKGYFYGAVLLIVTMFQSIILSQYFEKMFVVGMNLRTALISVIYRKSLRLSGAAKKESTVGEIVNLMSVDVQRFMDLIPYLNMLWSAPFQIALCCYFIYRELGAAMFSGLAVMIIGIPFNAIVASFSRKYQLAQMKNKDDRVKLMNEILGGVKVLKLYGWEESFMGQILDIRDREIAVLKKAAWVGAMINFVWISVPFIVALASFATYIFMGGGQILDPSKAFVTLTYLNILQKPMSVLPLLIIGLVQVGVSLDRINKFVNNEELDANAVQHDESHKDHPILVKDGTFAWGKSEPSVLRNINFKIPKGTLTAVVGTVGSGKSSLISALLGEMEKEKGSVNVVGSVAYVPQQAWMQNATLKNNILFGKELDDKKYAHIVDSCALKSDIQILPGGDTTEIGEKGINLSGGQKQRVSLARACYSESDVYLLDDPLSAVDSHVGKHIFEKVISHDGLLEGKTRVLVTHGITYLPKTDHIIVLKDGEVSEEGSYKQLLKNKGAFAEFLLEYMTEETEDEDVLQEIKMELEGVLGTETVRKEVTRRQSVLSKTRSESICSAGSVMSNDSTQVGIRKRKITMEESNKAEVQKPDDKHEPKIGTNLIEKEVAETGSVGLQVYKYYMINIGLFGVVSGVVIQIFYQVASIGTNYWLNVWTGEVLGDSSIPKYRDLYLGVYGGLGFASALSTLFLSITLAVSTLRASKEMHKSMLGRVMQSPMSFFDTTPLGRIVNRFAKDIDVCDNTLPNNLRQWLNTFASFLGTIILIITVIPIFAAVIVPVAVIFFFIQSIYVNTSRQLKRLESISRSPIYSHFGETITGASTIRAFGLQKRFIQESNEKVDINQICYYPSIIANRWLAIRLETIGNIITFAAAIFAIINPENIDPSQVGLIISYALNVTQVLNWLVRMTSDVETNIVAVERVKEYTLTIPQEAEWELPNKPPKEWPQEGEVTFEGYGMRYREGLDLVIKDISCHIKGGQTVGIVGRTGAGKSSLTVALFRLVEPAEGGIKIDGLDISQMGLHDLRKKLTIIPQDPVLFSGSLRINLDPFGVHSDREVWQVLELAHLRTFVSSLEDGLEHPVSEGGENLSVGQRQLICLARALLRKTKVLILDEATAAVDLETDDLIQSTIRKEFKGCTVLTIAHRLNTIMDYDRIIVLDKGRIEEFDSPQALLENPGSIFYSMARDANLV